MFYCSSVLRLVRRIVELGLFFGRVIRSFYGCTVCGQVEGICTYMDGVIFASMSDFGFVHVNTQVALLRYAYGYISMLNSRLFEANQ